MHFLRNTCGRSSIACDRFVRELARDCCKRTAPKAARGSSQIVAPGRDLSNPDGPLSALTLSRL